MRSPISVFVVSALLFIFGVGFVVVAARTARAGPSATAPPASVVNPVASTRQIMAAIVSPTSNAIFQSVQTNVTINGTEEIFPKNDDEWALLGAQAASLAEAGNMLMTDGRAIDRGDWIKMSQAMVDAAKETIKAVDKKNPEDVLASGEVVNMSCDTCHERYRRQ
jgi:hypothetical protein